MPARARILWVTVYAASAVALVACGGSSDGHRRPLRDLGSAPDAADAGGDPGPRDVPPGGAGESVGADVPAGPCQGLLVPPHGYVCADPPETPPHVVEGQFTRWAPGCPLAVHEWTCTQRASGAAGHAYFDYADGQLHVMNDWFLGDEGPIHPSCACRVRGFSADGLVTWNVLVYGDQSVTEVRNAETVQPVDVLGATGFGRSPLVAGRDHALCEVALPTLPGAFGLALRAPRGADPCVPDAPWGGDGSGGGSAEELYVTGVVTEDGVEDVVVDGGPALLALEPPRGSVGDEIALVGFGFGAAVGAVTFNGLAADVVSWSDERVRAEVPPDTRSGPVRVRAGTRSSNSLWFEIVCRPQCEGRACGGDGCGGSCGECAAHEFCAADATCTCLPDCAPWSCGADGCGGWCACAPGEVCDTAGVCRTDCEPECGARVCGLDGCGNWCGTGCQPGWGCNAGVCVRDCPRSCAGRVCGDDGCGGVCGVCGGERAECVDGTCECEPYCVNRVCGIDGCGGSCGTCPAGLTCVSGACQCVPQCTGRTCGDDGCGGSCGRCGGPRYQCVDGRCRCVPDCNGRECGADGCVGRCGTCVLGEECSADGRCVPCQPECEGRECGPDGCQGSCGVCPAQDRCVAGSCVCQPACEGRVCGDDGCEGSCGTCPDGQACDKNGVCGPAA